MTGNDCETHHYSDARLEPQHRPHHFSVCQPTGYTIARVTVEQHIQTKINQSKQKQNKEDIDGLCSIFPAVSFLHHKLLQTSMLMWPRQSCANHMQHICCLIGATWRVPCSKKDTSAFSIDSVEFTFDFSFISLAKIALR